MVNNLQLVKILNKDRQTRVFLIKVNKNISQNQIVHIEIIKEVSRNNWLYHKTNQTNNIIY